MKKFIHLIFLSFFTHFMFVPLSCQLNQRLRLNLNIAQKDSNKVILSSGEKGTFGIKGSVSQPNQSASSHSSNPEQGPQKFNDLEKLGEFLWDRIQDGIDFFGGKKRRQRRQRKREEAERLKREEEARIQVETAKEEARTQALEAEQKREHARKLKEMQRIRKMREEELRKKRLIEQKRISDSTHSSIMSPSSSQSASRRSGRGNYKKYKDDSEDSDSDDSEGSFFSRLGRECARQQERKERTFQIIAEMRRNEFISNFRNSSDYRKDVNDALKEAIENFSADYEKAEFCLNFPLELVLSLEEDVQEKIFHKWAEIAEKVSYKRSYSEGRLYWHFPVRLVLLWNVKFSELGREDTNNRWREFLNDFPRYVWPSIIDSKYEKYEILEYLPDAALFYLDEDVQRGILRKYFEIAKKSIFDVTPADKTFAKIFSAESLKKLNDFVQERDEEKALLEKEKEEKEKRDKERKIEEERAKEKAKKVRRCSESPAPEKRRKIIETEEAFDKKSYFTELDQLDERISSLGDKYDVEKIKIISDVVDDISQIAEQCLDDREEESAKTLISISKQIIELGDDSFEFSEKLDSCYDLQDGIRVPSITDVFELEAIRKRNAEFDANVKNFYTSLLTVPFDFVCPAGEEVRELLGALTLLRGNELTKEECLRRVGNLSVALVRDLFITPKVATSVLKCIKNIPKAKKAAQGICKLFKKCRATKEAANRVIGKVGVLKARIVEPRDISKIIKSAILPRKGGESIVGHALQKHAGRHPEIWGNLRGNADSINKMALKHLEDVLNSPGNFLKVKNSVGIEFLEKRLVDGRGVRLNLDKTFKGFID